MSAEQLRTSGVQPAPIGGDSLHAESVLDLHYGPEKTTFIPRGSVIFLLPVPPTYIVNYGIPPQEDPTEDFIRQLQRTARAHHYGEGLLSSRRIHHAAGDLAHSVSRFIGESTRTLTSLPEAVQDTSLSLATRLRDCLNIAPDIDAVTGKGLTTEGTVLPSRFAALPDRSRELIRRIFKMEQDIEVGNGSNQTQGAHETILFDRGQSRSDRTSEVLHAVGDFGAEVSTSLGFYLAQHPGEALYIDLSQRADRALFSALEAVGDEARLIYWNWKLHPVRNTALVVSAGLGAGCTVIQIQVPTSGESQAVEGPTPVVAYATPTQVYNPETHAMEEMTPEARNELQKLISDFFAVAPKARVPSFVFSKGDPRNPEHTILFGDVAVTEDTKVSDVIQDQGNNTFVISIPGRLSAYVIDARDASGHRDIHSFQVPTPVGIVGADFRILFDRSNNQVMFFNTQGERIAHVTLSGPQAQQLISDLAPKATATETATSTSEPATHTSTATNTTVPETNTSQPTPTEGKPSATPPSSDTPPPPPPPDTATSVPPTEPPASATARPTAKIEPTKTPETISLPRLHIEGPRIITEDGRTAIFKGYGINPHDRLSWKPVLISKYVMDVIAENERVGIHPNFIRLSVDADEFQTRPDISNAKDLNKLALQLEKKGIYLAIMPHTINGEITNLPNESVVSMMDTIAETLRDRSNVLYGSWLEPHNVGWNELNPWLDQEYSAITSHFSPENQPIIIVSPLNWGRDLRGMNINLPDGRFMVNIDFYPWKDPADEDVWNWFAPRIGTVPMLIGEIGGDAKDQEPATYWGSPDDLKVISGIFSRLDIPDYKGLVHISFWRGDGASDGTVNNGTITERGKLLRNSINNFPPTDFLNNTK